jgi:hypothetical protein
MYPLIPVSKTRSVTRVSPSNKAGLSAADIEFKALTCKLQVNFCRLGSAVVSLADGVVTGLKRV